MELLRHNELMQDQHTNTVGNMATWTLRQMISVYVCIWGTFLCKCGNTIQAITEIGQYWLCNDLLRDGTKPGITLAKADISLVKSVKVN